MQEEMENSSKSTKCTSRIELPAKGVIGVTIVAEEDTVLYEGSYDTDEVVSQDERLTLELVSVHLNVKNMLSVI